MLITGPQSTTAKIFYDVKKFLKISIKVFSSLLSCLSHEIDYNLGASLIAAKLKFIGRELVFVEN